MAFVLTSGFLFRYWEVQVDVGESVQGWIFWTWKARAISDKLRHMTYYTCYQAENADEWSYQKGLAGGWIPRDPTQRLYPGICSGSS